MKHEELIQRPHFVYRAFDAANRLLYIGCSVNVENRMKDHKNWSSWYSEMTNLTVEGPYPFGEARRIEWHAIQTERSLHNEQSHERRAYRRLGNRIWNVAYQTAVANGEDGFSAMHQACVVRDLEMPTFEEFAAMIDAECSDGRPDLFADRLGSEFRARAA